MGQAFDDALSDPLFQLLSEHSTDVLTRSDPAGRMLYISPACRRYGYEPHDLVGRMPQDTVHPDDLSQLVANTEALLRGHTPHPSDNRRHRMRTAAGDWVWMEGNPRVIRDAHGQPVEVINIFRDVTHKHELEEQVRAQGELFESAFRHAGVGKALVGMDGGFLRVNDAFCRIVGLPEASMLALDFQAITHPEDLHADLDLLRALTAGQIGAYEMDKRYIRPDGGHAWVHLTVSMVRGSDGAPKHYIAEVQDLSARRAAETALRDSEARCRAKAEEAEAATAAKSRFLANMSHEIRTPLTAVIGFAGLLAERTALTPEAEGYVDRIGAASRGLLAVVNDILDVSKLEAGQFTLSPRRTDALRECEETVMTLQGQAAAKGLALTFECDGPAPGPLMLDSDRLRQMLLNLVGNAVKFTDRGSVAVTVAYARDALHIEVQDTGPGLSRAQQAKLFQRFSQVDETSTRRHGGAGLGLAICRGIAQAMGGDVAVQSAAGKGACFRLHLPAPAAPEVAVQDDAAAVPSLDGLRILVVDDNAANRELARTLLSAFGADVADASDGAAAVERAATTPLDVILMDLRMPGMSGDQAMAAIRAQAGPNRDTAILAFTANADLEGRADPALDRFDGVIRKPIVPLEMCRTIAAVTAWRDVAEAADGRRATG